MNEKKSGPEHMPVAEANAMTSMPTGQTRACNKGIDEPHHDVKKLDKQEPAVEATWQTILSRADCSSHRSPEHGGEEVLACEAKSRIVGKHRE